MAMLLLLVWEILCRIHPERFYEQTNAALSRGNCRGKTVQSQNSLWLFGKAAGELIRQNIEKL